MIAATQGVIHCPGRASKEDMMDHWSLMYVDCMLYAVHFLIKDLRSKTNMYIYIDITYFGRNENYTHAEKVHYSSLI